MVQYYTKHCTMTLYTQCSNISLVQFVGTVVVEIVDIVELFTVITK